MERKELTLEEIKAVELDLLKRFHSVCKDNGFNYSLMGALF